MYAGILALLKYQKDLDEIRETLSVGICIDEEGNMQKRYDVDFMVGLTVEKKGGIWSGMWSDGVVFNSSHDSLAKDQAPPIIGAQNLIIATTHGFCYVYNENSEKSKESKGIRFSSCIAQLTSLRPFLCKLPLPPSSSVTVIIVVVLLIVIALSAAVGIGYMKKKWISNKVFGKLIKNKVTPANKLKTSEKNNKNKTPAK